MVATHVAAEISAGFEHAKHGRWAEMVKVVEQHTVEAVNYVSPTSGNTYLHEAAWHGESG